MSDTKLIGLDTKEWRGAPDSDETPIDLLANKELHDSFLTYVKDRLQMSERKMSNFYGRWQVNEKRVQGYIDLKDFEKELKAINDAKGAPISPVTITVPYTYATIATIVTYYVHTFTGRKPMFQIGTTNGEMTTAAQHMETLLQHNVDRKHLIKVITQWLLDDQIYGVGAIRTIWESKKGKRSVASSIGKTREDTTIFEGNDVISIDPYMFFPDPRVSMADVSEKGEFVFWRTFEGRHTLLKAQRDGLIKYVDKAGQLPQDTLGFGQSLRSLRAKGINAPGAGRTQESPLAFVQVDQGTIELIPAEVGLGSGVYPEKWLVTMLNKNQIVQAQPLDYDHDKHPVSVIESKTLGYGFGHLSTADYMSPIQDTVSWFINSHIHNVRAALNNSFVVNPAMVEMSDLASDRPGRIIRLKRSAMGQDVRTAIQQLQVIDVTQGHIGNLETFIKIGDMLSAVTDNLRGVQDSGGRKTATEVRTSGEAAASRLAAGARLISAQGISPWAEQMASNFQQFLTEEYTLQVLGSSEMAQVNPQSILGNFYFPVHDGTLPLDKIALLDTWKEIFVGMLQDPQLRQVYNVPRIFEWIAELGGARNIESFRLNLTPDKQALAALQSGNGVPIG